MRLDCLGFGERQVAELDANLLSPMFFPLPSPLVTDEKPCGAQVQCPHPEDPSQGWSLRWQGTPGGSVLLADELRKGGGRAESRKKYTYCTVPISKLVFQLGLYPSTWCLLRQWTVYEPMDGP